MSFILLTLQLRGNLNLIASLHNKCGIVKILYMYFNNYSGNFLQYNYSCVIALKVTGLVMILRVS